MILYQTKYNRLYFILSNYFILMTIIKISLALSTSYKTDNIKIRDHQKWNRNIYLRNYMTQTLHFPAINQKPFARLKRKEILPLINCSQTCLATARIMFWEAMSPLLIKSLRIISTLLLQFHTWMFNTQNKCKSSFKEYILYRLSLLSIQIDPEI